jgi:hypothetical protein
MINVGDKIYYIDYEESGTSYTVKGIENVQNNSFMKDGIWYFVHSDTLPNECGYHHIYAAQVDSDNRFFSSPTLAKKAYENFKKLHS